MKRLFIIVSGNNLDEVSKEVVAITKGIKEGYTTRAFAVEQARELAAKTPTVPVYVLESVCVIEAVQPKIVEKEWNERGEFGPTNKDDADKPAKSAKELKKELSWGDTAAEASPVSIEAL